MEIGELISVGFLDQLEIECPVKQPEREDTSEDDEEIADDDVDANQAPAEAPVSAHIEKNSGSKLGANLESGSQGAAGTVIDPPSPATPQPKIEEDSILVDGTGTKYAAASASKRYPYTVAAHHIIPGNASLRDSAVYKYMVKSASGSKVKKNIGYNVNGAHNGIFLPGWYGIRKKTSPDGSKWSELDDSWRKEYVGSVVIRTGRQFHDSHTKYNQHVKGILDSLAVLIELHMIFCDDCKADNEKKPPFYPLKVRLYSLSAMIRSLLTGHPMNWKPCLMTSDSWTSFELGELKRNVRKYIKLNPIPASGEPGA
jgi:hypothetical protein